MGLDVLTGDIWHLLNALALISYILIKELLLDRRNLTKQLHEAQSRKDPLKVLELDLNSLKSKVVNLEDAIEQQGDALNNKLDIILTEFKEQFAEHKQDLGRMRKDFTDAHRELSERLAAVETELKLKPNRRTRNA